MQVQAASAAFPEGLLAPAFTPGWRADRLKFIGRFNGLLEQSALARFDFG